MNRTQALAAVQRGGAVAVAAVVVAFGLAAFQPSRPPDWVLLVVGPLLVGVASAIYSYAA